MNALFIYNNAIMHYLKVSTLKISFCLLSGRPLDEITFLFVFLLCHIRGYSDNVTGVTFICLSLFLSKLLHTEQCGAEMKSMTFHSMKPQAAADSFHLGTRVSWESIAFSLHFGLLSTHKLFRTFRSLKMELL